MSDKQIIIEMIKDFEATITDKFFTMPEMPYSEQLSCKDKILSVFYELHRNKLEKMPNQDFIRLYKLEIKAENYLKANFMKPYLLKKGINLEL